MPSRGFGHKAHNHQSYDGPDDLEADRCSPRGGARIQESEPERDPIRESHATSNHDTSRDHEKSASSISLGALGLPCWNRSTVESQAKPRNESTGQELSLYEGRALDYLSYDEKDKAAKDYVPTSQQVADENCQNSGREATQVPDCDVEAREDRLSKTGVSTDEKGRKLFVEAFNGKVAACHALTISIDAV